MISLDPLIILLLLEGLLIQLVLLLYLYRKSKKLTVAYHKTLRIIRDFRYERRGEEKDENEDEDEKTGQGEEQSQDRQEPAFWTREEAIRNYQEENKEKERLIIQSEQLEKVLEEKMEQILQMKSRIEQMEKKYVAMEKEYWILYDKAKELEESTNSYQTGKTK